MGSTYKPQDAITYAKSMIKSMPIDVSANTGNWPYQTTDYVASLLWNAAPWKWTIGTLNTITVVAGTTDYTVSPPSDFLYLNKAYISEGSLTNELKIVSALPAAVTQIGNPSQIAYLDATNTVRVSPVPPATYSKTLSMLYKKQPPKITSANYGTTGIQVFPDCYFPVFQLGVLWLSYLYADDQRAGTATVDGEGKVQYTQALGAFMAGIAEMRKSEKVTLDFPQIPVLHG